MNRRTKIVRMRKNPGTRWFPMVLVVSVMILLAGYAPIRPVGAAELEIPSPGLPNLRAGLRIAMPGDVLLLAPGTYAGPIVLRKALTLAPRGQAGGAVTIDGGGRGRVVEIMAPGVVVRGLRLRNSGDDVEKTDACIYVHGKAAGARIEDNTLEQCLFGIWVNGAEGTRIERNNIAGIVKPIFSDRGNGINLWHVKKTLVRRNVIHRVRDGIYLSVSTQSEVRENLMHHLRFGIHYMYNDQNTIAGNVACNSMIGLAMMFSKNLEIRGNLALNNREHGILLRTILHSRIIANRSSGNNKGIFLNDSNFNVLRENHVTGNSIGVHLTAGSEDNQVYRNNFSGNPVQVRFTWSRPVQWNQGREGNYWSDYLGWDLDRDGRGDKAYYASNRLDMLLFRHPNMKLLATSPVVGLMQALEARFPVIRPPGVIDRYPSMRPFPPPSGSGLEFPSPEQIRTVCGSPGTPLPATNF